MPGPPRVDVDGPPLPPAVRARRRRWAIAGIIAGAALVLAIPVGLAVVGWYAFQGVTSSSATDAELPPDGAPDGAPDEPGTDPAPDDTGPDAGPDDTAPDDTGPDGGAARDQELDPPDLDTLDGVDVIYGGLLADIDASEQVMMSFQDEVRDVFGSPGAGPDDITARLQGIAADRLEDLTEVRDRLDASVDDPGAEAVRTAYVVHLDSWADYIGAVEQEPQVLAGEGADAGYTVAINATADAFARALEDELPPDVDAEVQRYAEGILDRGFRGFGQADV